MLEENFILYFLLACKSRLRITPGSYELNHVVLSYVKWVICVKFLHWIGCCLWRIRGGSYLKLLVLLLHHSALFVLRFNVNSVLQEDGNKFVKMGKKHYTEAIECYTKAIGQNIPDALHNSVCYANRAHVNLLLGNNRYAYDDATEAIKLNQGNVKACCKIPRLWTFCLKPYSNRNMIDYLSGHLSLNDGSFNMFLDRLTFVALKLHWLWSWFQKP